MTELTLEAAQQIHDATVEDTMTPCEFCPLGGCCG